MGRRIALLLGIFVSALLVVSCQVGSINPECGLANHGENVAIVGDIGRGGKFEPAVLCVNVGNTVQWTSRDEFTDHTVTSIEEGWQAFASDSISYGASFRVVFKKQGRYPYICSFHPGMTGLITVQS